MPGLPGSLSFARKTQEQLQPLDIGESFTGDYPADPDRQSVFQAGADLWTTRTTYESSRLVGLGRAALVTVRQKPNQVAL